MLCIRADNDDIITKTYLYSQPKNVKKAKNADHVIEGNLTSRQRFMGRGGPLLAKKEEIRSIQSLPGRAHSAWPLHSCFHWQKTRQNFFSYEILGNWATMLKMSAFWQNFSSYITKCTLHSLEYSSKSYETTRTKSIFRWVSSVWNISAAKGQQHQQHARGKPASIRPRSQAQRPKQGKEEVRLC